MGRVEKLAASALTDNSCVIGIAFSQVGDSFKGLPKAQKEQFRKAVQRGFAAAGHTDEPHVIFGFQSTSVMLLRSNVSVLDHGMYKRLSAIDDRRNAQWVDIACADGTAARLVNSHQPSSEANVFGVRCRRQVGTEHCRLWLRSLLRAPQQWRNTCMTHHSDRHRD